MEKAIFAHGGRFAIGWRHPARVDFPPGEARNEPRFERRIRTAIALQSRECVSESNSIRAVAGDRESHLLFERGCEAARETARETARENARARMSHRRITDPGSHASGVRRACVGRASGVRRTPIARTSRVHRTYARDSRNVRSRAQHDATCHRNDRAHDFRAERPSISYTDRIERNS